MTCVQLLQCATKGHPQQSKKTINDELKQKVRLLSAAEKLLLSYNRSLKSECKALLEDEMRSERKTNGSTGSIEEPDCSKDGEVDLLKMPDTKTNQSSLIPRSRSGPKVVKKPGRTGKGVSSATQLQTIHEDDEPIIPLSTKLKAKSAIVLLGEFPRVLLNDTSDVIDEVPTIYMEEESGSTSGINKPTTYKRKPATDFSTGISINGKKSIPRKRMFAEQPKKVKSLIPTLRKFFKTRKADRVEEIELPKRERREVLTAGPSGSKIPLLRRAPKQKKSLIPMLLKFFKTRKADRVEEIKLSQRERREVLTAPRSHKAAGPSGSKIPLLRRAR